MGLVRDVQFGQEVTLEHTEYGDLGSFWVEGKSGNVVRLIFQMPRAMLIRVLNHRRHGITFGLDGNARGPLTPLKQAAV